MSAGQAGNDSKNPGPLYYEMYMEAPKATPTNV